MKLRYSLVAAGALALSATVAQAAPVNGTGLVSPDVIFGSGNANGSFTGETANNVEVALRGKQRYPAANVFNYDGVDTYTFDSTVLTTNPSNRSVFNFEWSINVDASGLGGAALDDFDYLLSVDQDPSAIVNYLAFGDIINVAYADHSIGNFGTANGAGAEAADPMGYSALLASGTVAQNSWNLGFGFFGDPDLPGSYAFKLDVFAKGSTTVLASSQINVDVLPLPPVPLPATLPLGLLALAGLVGLRRRADKPRAS